MKRVLVIGGLGFIGSHLVKALMRDPQYELTIYDDESVGTLQNIAPVRDGLHYLKGSTLHKNALQKVMQGKDIVIDLAGKGSVNTYVTNPLGQFDENIAGAHTVMVIARDCGVSRLIMASSAAVYPQFTNDVALHEEMVNIPVTTYGAQMYAREIFARVYASDSFKIMIHRIFNAYGVQDIHAPYSTAIVRIIRAIHTREPFLLRGAGLSRRDWVHVDDITRALQASIDVPLVDPLTITNIGSGESVSLQDVIACIEREMGEKLRIVHQNSVLPEAGYSKSHLLRSARTIGYTPTVDLGRGIRETVAAYV